MSDLYGRLLFAWYWGSWRKTRRQVLLHDTVAGVMIALVMMGAVIIIGG